MLPFLELKCVFLSLVLLSGQVRAPSSAYQTMSHLKKSYPPLRHLAQSEEHVTLDFRVISSNTMLGTEITKKINSKKKVILSFLFWNK